MKLGCFRETEKGILAQLYTIFTSFKKKKKFMDKRLFFGPVVCFKLVLQYEFRKFSKSISFGFSDSLPKAMWDVFMLH